jgi:hypothetical protein
VQPGQLVWKTRDVQLEGRLRASFEGLSAVAARKLPVAVRASGRVGAPLTLELADAEGHAASASTAVALQAAAKRPLSAEDVAAAVGQLGENTLAVGELDLSGLDLATGAPAARTPLGARERREGQGVPLLCAQQQQQNNARAGGDFDQGPAAQSPPRRARPIACDSASARGGAG